MGAAVAVLLAKERHIVAAFEQLGAVTPERARTPDEVGVDQRLAWRRLREREIVREAGDGRYYLDVDVWRATRARRRRVAFVLLTIVFLALIFSIFVTQQRS